MDIRKLDLNLLILLDILVAEGSVTRAAKRAHLSQPAMSAALNRLRNTIQDPLLIRTSNGMKPTQRAKEIIGPIRTALANIHAALTPPLPSDIRLVERTFVIAASEYVSFVIMPRLIRELRRLAPQIAVTISRINIVNPFEPLRSSAVDLIIAAHLGASASIHQGDLFSDRYVCIAKKNHPFIKKRLTLNQFIEAPQLVIHGQAGGIKGAVDSVFQQLGTSRRVTIALPDFLAVPHIIMETDLIMNVARRVALSLRNQYPIQLFNHPFRREHFKVSQFWHQRSDADPVHRWLRELIQRVSRDVERGTGQKLTENSRMASAMPPRHRR